MLRTISKPASLIDLPSAKILLNSYKSNKTRYGSIEYAGYKQY